VAGLLAGALAAGWIGELPSAVGAADGTPAEAHAAASHPVPQMMAMPVRARRAA